MSAPEFTGFAFTDAVRFIKCARCKAEPGQDCRRPSGGRAWPPHVERERDLFGKYGTAPWTHPVITGDEFLKRFP